jgi:hypothetical protein
MAFNRAQRACGWMDAYREAVLLQESFPDLQLGIDELVDAIVIATAAHPGSAILVRVTDDEGSSA